MKYLITILLVQLTIINCLCQNKRKVKLDGIETDTIFVFQRFDNNQYKERKTFWSDTNEIGINYMQFYDVPSVSDAGYSFELSLIFFNWDSVEVNKDYNLLTQKDIKFECAYKQMWRVEKFQLSKGSIKVTSRTNDKLKFYFDLDAVSTDKRTYLIYKGEREFERDY